MSDIVLKMSAIEKSFQGFKALDGVDFELRKGEVHALVGENGAGKSTLMKCLAGIHAIDKGIIEYNGKPVSIQHPMQALMLGISFIHQELALAECLTIADNIFMGREPVTSRGFLDLKKMHRESGRLLSELNMELSSHARVFTLNIAQKQMVEIAKALSMNARVLIMDEPTAAVSQREVEKIFETIRKLQKTGISIIYISHRLNEIFKIADRITVLRDGHHIATMATEKVENDALVSMMVGRSLDRYYVRGKSEIGEVVLEAKELTRSDNKARNANLELRKGEIIGFSGLIGSGRTELIELLFGLAHRSKGKIFLGGKEINIRNPQDAVRYGISLVPEDRKLQGLIINNKVSFNITIAVMKRFIKFISVRKSIENQIAKHFIDELSIKVSSISQAVVSLSGGNQQKIVLSKWLAVGANILILDEPTRGIDVGAKADVYALMDRLSKSGISIIMISSEMPEIINMCDRVYVMRRGEIVACLEKKDASQERILTFALGIDDASISN